MNQSYWKSTNHFNTVDNSVTSGVNIFQGVILVVSNAGIVAVVMFQKQLREQKEYVLMAGLAATDVLTGIAVFLSGCWRAVWSILGEGTKFSSPKLNTFLLERFESEQFFNE